MNSQRFQAAVDHLHSFINFEKHPPSKYTATEYNLDRMRDLLRLLGNPHDGLHAIHVAGTDGKGSTATLCAHLLTHLGFHVGLNTSPHLETIRERFRVDGRMIPEQTFIQLFERVLAAMPKAQQAPPTGHGFATVFEMITAIAFLYFAGAGLDYAVVEVGMGGRLDATNVLRPEVGVIMQLGIDHTRHLGATLEAIAREKLGIVKPGLPVVVSPQRNISNIFVLNEVLERGGIPRFVADEMPFRIIARGVDGYVFEFVPRGENEMRRWRTRALGDHQVSNACTALLTLDSLPELHGRMPWDALAKSLEQFYMPGRFELLYNNGSSRVVLDVAHTHQAARVLLFTLDQVFYNRPRCFVIAQLRDKDTHHYLQTLLRPEDRVVLTEVENPRTRTCPEVYQVLVEKLGFPAEQVVCEPNAEAALERTLEVCDGDHLVVATGSLYLVGALRTMLRAMGYH